jgi:hypothetical protein
MPYQIENMRGNIIYKDDIAKTFKECVENAIRGGADLTNANFEDRDLAGINFTNAKLNDASFRGADLTNIKLENLKALKGAKNLRLANFDKNFMEQAQNEYRKKYSKNKKEIVAFVGVRFDKDDRDLLLHANPNIKTRGSELLLDLIKDETENGFNTISFEVDRKELEAYLDVRYESGGAYQLTSESRKNIKKAKATAGTIGVISKKELDEKFPELGKAYESVYVGKKPDIKIVSGETFSFPVEQYSMGSWHTVFAYYQDQVKQIPVEKFYGKQEKLRPDSMILDCLTGNLNICYLYIHPSNTAPLLKGDDDLSEEECLVLNIMSGLKPAYREKEFFDLKYPRNWEEAEKNKDEYKKTLRSLESKGLVKISSSGAAQLTLNGKNKAHLPKVKEVTRKYRGY